MQTSQTTSEATELYVSEVLAAQLYCLSAVVRALVHAHPDPARVKAEFDLLLGQMLAHPGFLADPARGAVLRDFAQALFQPPVVLDTSR